MAKNKESKAQKPVKPAKTPELDHEQALDISSRIENKKIRTVLTYILNAM